ncbi:MAG TPA: GYF domain-containing protein [Gemmataceae bacterium]|nr:GYF domain-containing protein [Gemmataceae bacterium]
MSIRWYYSHDGKVHGPFSDEEVKDRAARQLLLKTDLIWPENRSPQEGAPASVVVEFPQAESPIPDWLADVASVQSTGPIPGPSSDFEIPDWLEDLRLWIALGAYSETNSNVTLNTGAVPDWLEDWLVPEKPKKSWPATDSEPGTPAKPSEGPAMPIPPKAAPSPASTLPATSQPVALATPIPSKSASPPASPTSTVPAAKQPAVPDSASPQASPTSTVPAVKQPAGSAPVDSQEPPVNDQSQIGRTKPDPSVTKRQLPSEPRAHPSLEEIRQTCGFDPESGEILDPVKMEKWRKSQNTPVKIMSLMEAFHKARCAIEDWIDDDANRSSIMHSDVKEIRCIPEIHAILREYAGYGQTMQERLLLHLEFMVINRRKYYQRIEKSN